MDIKIIGSVLFIGIFGFQVWYAIHTKNWGKFDRTSQIVWGSLILICLVIAGGVFALIHSS
jgi:hypothetical protein